ncbi:MULTISPECIES: nuclear transport factor 2 family protein [Actinosynnema]|uniref:nuclear transport factor 2 family protein n=1 Tax=Actinosynnema TaxID=40566 RepID=UPI0020A5A7F5|nr:nuclear transport factor 2 family protein [Actinosynnema pretiosum]MCP2096411.1 SnoaL-like domain-containing protein [Actinosynnema pretiosum]
MALTTEDRLEITETLSLLGHLADSGGPDRLEEVFTPDAVYDLTAAGMGAFTGIDAIREAAGRIAAHGPVAHHLTNVVIGGEEQDGVVSALSKGLLLMADGKVESIVMADDVRRHGDGWRIARHVVTPQRAPRRLDAHSPA